MRKGRIFLLLAIIFLAVIGAALFDAPFIWNSFAKNVNRIAGIEKNSIKIPSIPERPFRLGLDLQGGTHLVYEADLSQVTQSESADAMEGLRDVIERRVNLFGVQEPVVQVLHTANSWRLVVELAGIKDVKQAIEMIGQTPFLEFREPRLQEETDKILKKREELQKKFAAKEEISPEEINAAMQDPDFQPTSLTGRYLKKANLSFSDVTKEPVVLIEFDDEGKSIFADLTKKHVEKPIAIYVDNIRISAPKVQEEITSGSAQITGKFSIQEARSLVRNLNSGALPIPIKLLSQQTVEASLGALSLTQSLRAGVWGIIAVALFMVIVYRVGGFFSLISLVTYGAFLLLLFKAIPVTLTLAGIAGIILSFGMAVDTNVLIAERMREEKEWGRDFKGMMHEGFSRAWPSIRDGHLTTLITCIVLFFMGTGFLQGFAFSLGIGVILSMGAAMIVSRLLMSVFVGTRFEKWPIWTR